MSTFLQKLRTVTLGTAHDLLDKAIDLNSPSALRQYVRDLEDALDRMRNEAAVQAGTVRTLTRELGDLQTRIDTGTAAAGKYQAAGKTDLARVKASDVIRAKESFTHTSEQLLVAKDTSAKLDLAVSQLEAKHTDMVSKVRDLERMDRTTKSMEQSAGTLAMAGKLVSSGADISIDDIQSKMTARNDVATEKFNRAMGTVQTEDDPEHVVAVDDFLAGLTPKVAVTGQ